MNSFRMIIKYWMKSKKSFWISTSYQIISTILTIFIPIFIGDLVGQLIPSNIHLIQAWNLWKYFILIIGLGFTAFYLGRLGRIKGAVVSSQSLYFLRQDINSAIFQQSFSYYDKTEVGELVARATSDVEQTDMIFGFGLAVGMQSILQVIMVILATLVLNIQVGLIFIIIIPISIIGSILITRKLKSIFLETRQSFGQLTNTIRENIIGAPVVRIFSTEQKEWKKFTINNQKFLNASVRTVKYQSFYMPFNLVLISIITIFLLFYGGTLILNHNPNFTVEILISFLSYAGTLVFPFVNLGQILIMYIQADAALIRIREVLESSPEVKEEKNPIVIDRLKGEVQFENVSFGYTPMRLILNNLNFALESGKKLAIIGTTGSGKSTIINLLPRFYDVSEGIIYMDNINIKRYRLKDLRRNIGIVSQDTFLFNKSIKDNIKFGKDDATDEEIIEMAKIADLDNYIQSLPEGYNTIVGERGTFLSGGQKQRLSIARALIIHPTILIFDDSTSSVDVETEYNIQKALNLLMKNATTFIITQRISTIRNADEIMVLDKGRIVGLDTHNNLIKNNLLYQQIYSTLYKKQKSNLDESKVF